MGCCLVAQETDWYLGLVTRPLQHCTVHTQLIFTVELTPSCCHGGQEEVVHGRGNGAQWRQQQVAQVLCSEMAAHSMGEESAACTRSQDTSSGLPLYKVADPCPT